MEVTALCVRLLMNVLMVQNSYCALQDGAAFPRLLPNRLQFFEYESISLNCEFGGSADWRVMRTLREIHTNTSNWVTSAGSGTIYPAFASDSGEYWCEAGDGLRGNAVNITVTAGSVILESPVVPVKEGDHVTLHCQKKKSPADLIAEFYKDGLRIRSGYEGKMSIHNVSTSDDGLYKCNISGAGESAESRLAVRVFSEPHEETLPSLHSSPHLFTPLWIVVTLLPVVLLLLLVLGALHYRKHKGAAAETGGSPSRGGDDVVDPHHPTYAVVQKPRKEIVTGGDVVDPDHLTYALVKRKAKEPNVSKAKTKPSPPEESVVYSTVNCTEMCRTGH